MKNVRQLYYVPGKWNAGILNILICLPLIFFSYAKTLAQDFTISRSNGSSGLAICAGEDVSFMAGISATSYTWYINESQVSTDLNVGQPQVLIKNSWGYSVGSTIRCVAQTTNGTKYSNTLTTTTCVPPVKPAFTVGITVAPFRYPPVYCVDEVTFTATASHPANFTWYKNGLDIGGSITPSLSNTYDPEYLSPTDVLSVVAWAANPSAVQNPSDQKVLNSSIFSIGQNVGIPEIFLPTEGTCQATQTYFNATAQNGRTYEWSIEPSTAGTINVLNDNGSSTRIDWTGSYFGTPQIKVKANGCNGDFQPAEKPYNVYKKPSLPIIPTRQSCDYEVLTLNGTPGGDITDYRWYTTDNQLLGQGLEQRIALLRAGSYSYKFDVLSQYGCVSESKGTLTVEVVSSCDGQMNWIETTLYNGKNEGDIPIEVSHSKSYFDFTGRGVQSQSKNLTANKIFSSAAVEDKFGRVALSTLSAPTGNADFSYKHWFVTDVDGKLYDYKALGNPLGQESGTVGWYYSPSNSSESYVPQTSHPYSRVDYYEDGFGAARKAAGPGEALKLGTGHEVVSGVFPVFHELDNYLSRRTEAISGIVQDGSLLNEGVQSVSRDQNGKYVVSISDKSGTIVMSARKGTNDNNAQTLDDHVLEVINTITSSADPASVNYRPLTYFYILEDQSVAISTGGNYVIEDILAGAPYEIPSDNVWKAGFYRILLSSGSVDLTYKNYFLDVSYQFYDDAGRLKSSVSPNGVKQLKQGVPFSDIDKTTYEYNHRGWLLSMNEPDAGLTQYVYRKDGKIRFSQNAEQKVNNRFSYTHYDQIGRPVESGVYSGIISFLPMSDTYFVGSVMYNLLEMTNSQINWPASVKRDWIKTSYDTADGPIPNLQSLLRQDFVRGAVSYTENANNKTWYSYDEFGRVTWMAQKPNALVITFVSEYMYDFSGNVLQVKNAAYKSGASFDMFYHHYQYDADMRLHTASTSIDGANMKLRATYEYYLHGPLKRIELGEKLQGIDFVYNIQGWLTQINHPENSQDPGHDGASGSDVRADVFGMVLDYYESAMSGLYSASTINPSHYPELFHGLPAIERNHYASQQEERGVARHGILKAEMDGGNEFRDFSAGNPKNKQTKLQEGMSTEN